MKFPSLLALLCLAASWNKEALATKLQFEVGPSATFSKTLLSTSEQLQKPVEIGTSKNSQLTLTLSDLSDADSIMHVLVAFELDRGKSDAPLITSEPIGYTGRTFLAEKKSSNYRLFLDFEGGKVLLRQSGEYRVIVYVASSLGKSKSLSWHVGNVKYSCGSMCSSGRSSAQPRGDAGDVFEPLPEIEHQFRPDHKMPPALISIISAIVVVGVPWVVLSYLWFGVVGVSISTQKISALFSDGQKLLNFIAFIIPLGLFLAVLVMYWLWLSIFDAITYLGPLSVILLITTRNCILDFSTLSGNK